MPLPKKPKKFKKVASLLRWVKREARVRGYAGHPSKGEQSRAKEDQ
jgi:hypothetical protein